MCAGDQNLIEKNRKAIYNRSDFSAFNFILTMINTRLFLLLSLLTGMICAAFGWDKQ